MEQDQKHVDAEFRRIVGKPRYRMYPRAAEAIGAHIGELLQEHGVLGGLIEFRISDDDDHEVKSGSFEWDLSQTVREDAIEAKCEADGDTDCNDYSATTAEILPRFIEYMREEGDHESAAWYSQYLPTRQGEQA